MPYPFASLEKLRASELNDVVADYEADLEATDETGFTSTTFTPGANVCGTTFVAPASGAVVVFAYSRLESNTAGVRATMSLAVRAGAVIGSGTSVSAASNNKSLQTPTDASGGGNQRTAGTIFEIVSGLTPGDTYNAQTEHTMESAGNGDVFDRAIFVLDLA
jgi:hypothetical protein